MISLLDLWLPILVSAVFVFIASSVIHMAIPIHKNDFKKLANEADVLTSMREHGVQQGSYMFPCAGSMKEMGTPEHVEKMNLGPVGFLTVLPNGPYTMGKSLTQWLVFSIVVGIFVAYIASMGLSAGADSMMVFRMTAATAILAYAVSHVPDSIWKGLDWGVTAKFLFDGLVYGLVTAVAFAWMWPGAA